MGRARNLQVCCSLGAVDTSCPDWMQWEPCAVCHSLVLMMLRDRSMPVAKLRPSFRRRLARFHTHHTQDTEQALRSYLVHHLTGFY